MTVQIEVREHRAVVDHHVVDGVEVGVVAREEQLLRDQPAPDLVATLEQGHPQAGAGQVGCRYEPIVPRPHDYDIPLALSGELLNQRLQFHLYH